MNIDSLRLMLWHVRVALKIQADYLRFEKSISPIREVRRIHGRNGARWYVRRLIQNGGRCDLCRQRDRLVVDHCHTTGFLRGLLCVTCNSALPERWEDGNWRDRALRYLDSPESKVFYSPRKSALKVRNP